MGHFDRSDRHDDLPVRARCADDARAVKGSSGTPRDRMTRDVWLARHPYLQPVADVHALVEAMAAGVAVPTAPIPDWDHYASDFHAGVPLLQSSTVAFDFAAVETAVYSLIREV